MMVIHVRDFEIFNLDSNYPDPDLAHLSDVPRDMTVPTRCPNCKRDILGTLAAYAKGITCISCQCTFKYVYNFPLHE